MGFFSKVFEKKVCSVCGGEIGLLGNRKLEDGNLCKNCAGKLSPFFSDRRSSTVEQIKAQLAYREDNQKEVAAFHTTLSLGDDTKVLIDEDAGKFMVTRARDLAAANPDVIAFSQVTGCDLDIDEDTEEEEREDAEGNRVSYDPPRYHYRYDFYVKIRVNHPYFDEIQVQLNDTAVETTDGTAVPAARKPDPRMNTDYREYEEMGRQIKEILTNARQQARDAAAPKAAVTCPYCGATTTPDAAGRCEYCGASL
ncbi:MAG: DUF4428 domain-containing protein [Acutalibacteraceae bacterium]|jgi:hypothetical protein